MSKLQEGKWLKSVGIDLGTSTTKWIASLLKVTETSSGSSLPRYEITERSLAYVSPVYSTPMQSESEINLTALTELLEREYQQAGIQPSDVQTGAVIITGETATKDNAERIVHALAGDAGQFVVAAAGADLEALLAGRGSGAAAYSGGRPGVIVNVDVGGGTANAAYFRNGVMVGTITFHIGGRLIRLSSLGQVEYVSEHWRRWAQDNGCTDLLPAVGSLLSFSSLTRLCKHFVQTLLLCIVSGDQLVGQSGAGLSALLVSPPSGVLPPPDEIWISGGIGALMEAPAPVRMEEAARFGDIGPELGAQLSQVAQGYPVLIRQAAETARATVIGAGSHTTEISGATLHYDKAALPLRNIPVVIYQLPEEEKELEGGINTSIQTASGLYGSGLSEPPFAIALKGRGVYSYRRVQKIAEALSASYMAAVTSASVLLVICQSDMAKALGHALLKRLTPSCRVVCVDQIDVLEGDYVDVGLPFKEDIVPVIIKTLVFHQRESEGA